MVAAAIGTGATDDGPARISVGAMRRCGGGGAALSEEEDEDDDEEIGTDDDVVRVAGMEAHPLSYSHANSTPSFCRFANSRNQSTFEREPATQQECDDM